MCMVLDFLNSHLGLFFAVYGCLAVAVLWGLGEYIRKKWRRPS